MFERFRSLLQEREAERAEPVQAHAPSARPFPMPHLAAVGSAGPGIDRFSSGRDWDGLIHQVQGVAQHFRDTERQLQEGEQRIEQLLIRAEQESKAAAMRVQAAEARAQSVEAILAQLRDTILSACGAVAGAGPSEALRPQDARPAPASIRRVA